MSKYHPRACEQSINMGGVYICGLQTVPCALHKGEKCYMQRTDEAVKALAGAIAERDGKTVVITGRGSGKSFAQLESIKKGLEE